MIYLVTRQASPVGSRATPIELHHKANPQINDPPIYNDVTFEPFLHILKSSVFEMTYSSVN